MNNFAMLSILVLKLSRLCITVTVSLLLMCALSGRASELASETASVWVSLVRLIANPARYEGIVVEVTGYLDSGGSLFLTKDHADAFDSSSGIQFADTTEEGYIIQKCTGSYATLTGTFRIRRGEPALKDAPTFYALYDLKRVVTVKNGVTTICWEAQTASKK